MLTVTAKFRIFPGKEAAAEEAINAVVSAVNENEPGTLCYAWHLAIKDPSQILVFEVYRDDEAVAAHRAAPYLADFQKLFVPDGVFDPDSVKIERYARIAEVSR